MGFEPRPPNCSGCKVRGLQHGATTPSAALFALNYWLRYFLLSTVTSAFELRCQSKATDTIVLQNLFVLATVSSVLDDADFYDK